MTVRIDEHGCLIVGNCALPAAVVPAVEAFYREKFEHGGVVAEEPEWEYGIHSGITGNVISVGAPWMDHAFAEEVTANFSGNYGVRRRKAGEWVPVKQEGTET